MDSKELHSSLVELIGQSIGHSTLRKYVEKELAPPSEVKSLGRGEGRESKYPEEALGQFYAAWMLLNGPIRTRLDNIKIIRIIALKLLEIDKMDIKLSVLEELECSRKDLAYLIDLWLNYCEDVNYRDYVKYRVDIDYEHGSLGTLTLKSSITRKVRPANYNPRL